MNLPMDFLTYPSECPPLILISCDITDREGKYAPMRLGHEPFIGGNCHWQPNGDHNHLISNHPGSPRYIFPYMVKGFPNVALYGHRGSPLDREYLAREYCLHLSNI